MFIICNDCKNLEEFFSLLLTKLLTIMPRAFALLQVLVQFINSFDKFSCQSNEWINNRIHDLKLPLSYNSSEIKVCITSFYSSS